MQKINLSEISTVINKVVNSPVKKKIIFALFFFHSFVHFFFSCWFYCCCFFSYHWMDLFEFINYKIKIVFNHFEKRCLGFIISCYDIIQTRRGMKIDRVVDAKKSLFIIPLNSMSFYLLFRSFIFRVTWVTYE